MEEIKSYGLNLSEADLKGALKNEQITDKKDANAKKEGEEDDLKDYQLIRELELVKALYLYGKNDSPTNNEKAEQKAAE